MYTLDIFSQNRIKVWWICYTFAILIFPFFVKIKVAYVNKQYLNIKIYLFGVRIFYIFIQFGFLKIKLLFKRKIMQVEYYKILPFNNVVNDILDIKVYNTKAEIIYSSPSIDKNLSFLFVMQYYLLILNTISIIKNINSSNDFCIVENDEYIKYKLNIKFLFNLLTIFEALAKILIGKIIKWKKKITE